MEPYYRVPDCTAQCGVPLRVLPKAVNFGFLAVTCANFELRLGPKFVDASDRANL